MDLGLAGKIAIVTGSSRGLGLAGARALATEGCRVVICGRTGATLDAEAGQLATLASADHVRAVRADVSTPGGIASVVDEAVRAFGGIDVLVNNVGLARGGGLLDTDDASW